MAKAFSETEKSLIRAKLKETATVCLRENGIRKTSVEDLARAAGISKGAFYIFYRSKEELFFDVINDYHETAEQALTARFSAVSQMTSALLTDILVSTFKEVGSSFLPKLLSGGELELLMRRLPPDVVASHQDSDTEFFSRVFTLVPGLAASECGRYSAALRAIFLLLLHKREIGETLFDDVLEMLISGVVRDMFGEVAK